MKKEMILKTFQIFCQSLDLTYSQAIIDKISSFGDDPATGNRSAGSKAATDVSYYLMKIFKEIGLSSVTCDEFDSCGWTFKGANLEVEKTHYKVTLGGYATHFIAKHERIKLVDGGTGSASELEALGDIKDKLVLITLDLTKDFFMTYYAYQAYVKGAKGVLVATKYKDVHEDILISQDASLPEYVKMLAISLHDADVLKRLIQVEENHEINVILNSNSEVFPHQVSSNVWGDIKGKTDDVIYFIAHYDGYYHSFFDDASGVGTILGIAKALIKSEYKPEKTIRFVAHGAEEWGITNSDYDWGTGAYQQITHIHPEWASRAFALINIDGSFPITGERNFLIRTSPEIKQCVTQSLAPYIKNSPYNIEIVSPTITLAEQFSYERCGVLAIVASEQMEESIYYRQYYHSSKDNKSVGMDLNTFEFNHQLYGLLALKLDRLVIRPVDFYERFTMFKNSLGQASEALQEVIQIAHQLTNKINQLNETSTSKAHEINDKLFKIFKEVQDNFVSLNWNNEIVFPHESVLHNIKYLTLALEELNTTHDYSNVITYLTQIDGNELALKFDKQTYDYFTSRRIFGNDQTFGYNLIKYANENLYDVIQNVKENKIDKDKIIEALKRQESYLEQIITKEEKDLETLKAQLLKLMAIF